MMIDDYGRLCVIYVNGSASLEGLVASDPAEDMLKDG